MSGIKGKEKVVGANRLLASGSFYISTAKSIHLVQERKLKFLTTLSGRQRPENNLNSYLQSKVDKQPMT